MRVQRTAREALVYNLSVAGIPEYFANGVLVHNCADAALYGWRMSRHYLAQPPKAPKPSADSEEAFEADIMRRMGGKTRKRGLL